MRSIRTLASVELGAHLRVLAALVEHLLRALGVGDGEPPLLRELRRGGELVVRAAGVGVALAVPDHFGVRHRASASAKRASIWSTRDSISRVAESRRC